MNSAGPTALPRGRSSLAPADASAIQRLRLTRAAVEALAELGYAHTTVREVVRRAHVSLRTFYEQFADLEDCLLTAVAETEEELALRVGRAIAERAEGSPPLERLRAAFEENMAAWAREPELATVLHLELRSAGPAGRRRYFEILGRFARYCRAWHREVDPAGAAATPPEAYQMAMGAVEQLVTERVDAGRIEELGELADPAFRVTLATLSVWSGHDLAELQPTAAKR